MTRATMDEGSGGLRLGRRRLLAATGVGLALTHAAFAAPGEADAGIVDVAGHLPPLRFTMTSSANGQLVTARAYRRDVVLVYFGFTRCPDSCPLTVQNAARLLHELGSVAQHVRFLFVTVDLDHDKPAVLRRFLARFCPPPGINGLYGTPAELQALAKRYGVDYRAPTGPDAADPVSAISHGDALYLFGRDGKAEAIISDFSDARPPIRALAAKIRTLI